MSFMILHTINGILPKGDIKMQGNIENVEEIKIESQNHDYLALQDPHHLGFNAEPMKLFIPKIDMRKFDGKHPITWIFHMEQFFDLHQVPSLQKVPITFLYLENNQFLWCQWICERKIILSYLGPFLQMN
jgi:hypothetical protein